METEGEKLGKGTAGQEVKHCNYNKNNEKENVDTTTIQVPEDIETTPLYQLMKRLLDEDEATDDTLVSQDHLKSILQMNFKVNFKEMHHTEIESYINILKWSLKCWPGWEKVAKEYKDRQQKVNKNKVIREFMAIKKYIDLRLRITDRCFDSIEQKQFKLKSNDKLFLKLSCTQRQLKYLVNNRPSKKFHLINFGPSKPIEDQSCFQWMSFMDVFNWPYLEVYVDLPNFSYTHKNVSMNQYKMINLKASHEPPVVALDRTPHCRIISTKRYGIKKDFLSEYLEQAKTFASGGNRLSNKRKNDLMELFDEILKDISVLKDHIIISANYKYNLSNYNYVQNLANTVDVNSIVGDTFFEKYKTMEIRLQNIITPQIIFSLNKFQCTFTHDDQGRKKFKLGLEEVENDLNNWLKIYCNACGVCITGFLNFNELNAHLVEFHGSENEWQCVKCKIVFNALNLAYHRWYHTC